MDLLPQSLNNKFLTYFIKIIIYYNNLQKLISKIEIFEKKIIIKYLINDALVYLFKNFFRKIKNKIFLYKGSFFQKFITTKYSNENFDNKQKYYQFYIFEQNLD